VGIEASARSTANAADSLEAECVHDFLYLLRVEPLDNVSSAFPRGHVFRCARIKFPAQVHVLGYDELGELFQAKGIKSENSGSR
jgi:hypothetical protein